MRQHGRLSPDKTSPNGIAGRCDLWLTTLDCAALPGFARPHCWSVPQARQ
jgi:hypothetical protein